jgi:hypothetical protein
VALRSIFVLLCVVLCNTANAQISLVSSLTPTTGQLGERTQDLHCDCGRWPFPPECSKKCPTCSVRIVHLDTTSIVIDDCSGQRRSFHINAPNHKLGPKTARKAQVQYKKENGKQVVTSLTLRSKKQDIVLIAVPHLGNLSQGEAEQQLSEVGLKPEARPQVHPHTPKDRIIRGSLAPAAGTLVEPGTVVHFGVSTLEIPPPSACRASLTISRPSSVAPLRCELAPEGYGLCQVTGTVSHMSGNCAIALWVRLVRPQAGRFVWYFQRGDAGHIDMTEGISWEGTVQVGDSVYTPHRGDVVDISASIVDRKAFDGLLGAPTIIWQEPVGQHVRVRARVTLE